MPKLTEYYGEIRAQTDDSADLFFYGDIVSSWWGAWDDDDQWPGKVKEFLDGIKGKSNLNIYINSGGGSVMAIYNMLARHKAKKTVHVDGLAASMASIIALAGDRVIIPANAWLMIHQPWSYTWGNADEMEKEVKALRSIEQGMLNTYAAKGKQGVTRDQLFTMMKGETWLTGDEAAKYFNVEVAAASNAAAWLPSEHYGRYKNKPAGVVLPKDEEPLGPAGEVGIRGDSGIPGGKGLQGPIGIPGPKGIREPEIEPPAVPADDTAAKEAAVRLAVAKAKLFLTSKL